MRNIANVIKSDIMLQEALKHVRRAIETAIENIVLNTNPPCHEVRRLRSILNMNMFMILYKQ